MALLIWRGPSQLDGRPILLALSGHDTPTTNIKTGPVLQTWILPGDQSPADAVKTGADSSVCGSCPNRHHTGGGCYVLPWQAPQAIWRSVQGHEPWMPSMGDLAISNTAKALRIGSYGDPMAVPVHVWKLLQLLVGDLPIIGYTHQWFKMKPHLSREDHRWYMQHLQASVDTREGAVVAAALGYTYFRVLREDETPTHASVECPASVGSTTCDQCMLCASGRNIWIRPHGARANRFNPK